jgi:hypothetical protein
LGNGLTSKGYYDHRSVVDQYGIPASLEGKTVLDVGTADGFWAFELERRGASRVVGINIARYGDFDWLPWVRDALGPRADINGRMRFELAHAMRDSKVEFEVCSVYDLSPERVGTFDVHGSTVVFEVVVDDYAEVWVNGELPHTLGDSGGHVAAGFNAPNRVVLTRDARPGATYTIAVFGINGPISASPRNYIWVRTATLDFYAPAAEQEGPVERLATGFDGIDAVLPSPDGSVLFASGGTIYRWYEGAVTVFRPKSDAIGLAWSEEGLLVITQPGRVLRVNPHGDTTVLDEAPVAEDIELALELPEPARCAARAGDVVYAGGESSLYRISMKGAT